MALTWPCALHGYTGSPRPDQCLVTFHSIKITQMLQCFQPELWKSTHQPCRQPLAGYFHSPFRGLSPAVMWPVVKFDMEAAPRSHQMKQSRTVCHWRVLITAWPLGFQLLRNQAALVIATGMFSPHTAEGSHLHVTITHTHTQCKQHCAIEFLRCQLACMVSDELNLKCQ